MMSLMPRRFYMDDMFDDFMEPSNNGMKCDIYEKEGKYHIEMDIPGFDKKDIKIESDKGYLTIKAEHKYENDDKSKKYIRRERGYGKYAREFYLGDIDSENIHAEFNNGVLTVVVPTLNKIETKKTIEIE